MATISKKRAREFDKLKSQASDVWSDQKEALGSAGHFWHDVGVEAAAVAVKDVAPRVRSAIDKQVKPAVATGVSNASSAAAQGRDKLVNDVAPAVADRVKSSPLAEAVKSSPLADAVDFEALAKSGKKLSRKAKRKAAKRAAKFAAKHPRGTVKVAKVVRNVKKSQKKGLSGGSKFLIVLGVIGIGAVVFAAVQTLRADDELWVADDADSPSN